MDASTSRPDIKTRFLIISDTHGHELPSTYAEHADVAIHCGDLTTESKIEEIRSAIDLLKSIDAPLKLVIAGNHDFTMDIPMFQRKVREVNPPLDPELVRREYGDYGEVRGLFDEAKSDGIIFLDEGPYTFSLSNGASLKVYASPYTPSLGDWGFQYHPEVGHNYTLGNDVDVVITHGPPRGIMDMTYSGGRAGCPALFEAIAQSRPRMHCFGHIHEGWGAKLVTWRRNISERPSHLTDIDNGSSTAIAKLSQITPGTGIDKSTTSHCVGDPDPLKVGAQTLFVNAAYEGTEDFPAQPPWLVELELPPAG
ncbi:metallophosphoesterase domain-containing protein [Aspergillus pseudoustus]|uniref:Metallophosphoesterase domain-containing protein n=1 Tax=Aspergillus pseudoustus TaxID=1810923 RepID=A0ABR4JCJ2_9EURO